MAEILIGVMSGSSLDGIDYAACSFSEGVPMPWQILDTVTVPYTDEWHQRLQDAPQLSGFELQRLDADLGSLIGTHIQNWIAGKSWKPDAIASHGHTVFHEPGLGFTTQVGSGAHILAECHLPVITHFRNTDVALGGQGAPFAPAADRQLYPGYQGYLNLGGITNVLVQTTTGEWKSWDIGPCNQALNFLARRTGHHYDEGGKLATLGAILDSIRHDLVAMFPYKEGTPLGLSNAQVAGSWIEYLLARQEDPVDLLSTTTLAIADMITMHLSPSLIRPAKILVTGGGAHNDYLLELLQRFGMDYGFTYEKPATQIIDHKESVLMAYLGYLYLHGKTSGIHQMTGAHSDSIAGAMFKYNS